MKSLIFRNIENRWISDNEYLSDIFQECKRGEIEENRWYMNSQGLETPYMIDLERIININNDSLLNYNSENYLLEAIKSDGEFNIKIISKTQELIEKYYLKDNKRDLKNKLLEDYNKTKKITIQNGNILTIAHDDKHRKYFKNILEKYIYNISPLDLISKDVVIFFNEEFQINMIPFFWNRLFHECFKKPTPTGLKEYIFPFNKQKYTFYKQKIEEAETKQDLDNIKYEFYNPEGIVVDINVEAEKLIADESLKAREDYNFLMNILESARGDDGKIHLIDLRK